MTRFLLATLLVLPLSTIAEEKIIAVLDEGTSTTASHEHMDAATLRRVPAEWEPQEAIWLQWPGPWEETYEEAFAAFSCIIIQYERLHVLYQSPQVISDAKTSLLKAGCNPDHDLITWHDIPNDSAWMRDNGPIFVTEAGTLRLQNWQFDAWGGRFGDEIQHELDDLVPVRVAEYLDMPVDEVHIVHERGNLEFDGAGAVILNWSALGDPERNPGYTKDQAERDLKHWFGVSKVVFLAGVPERDRTNGHVDGIARFIDTNTVVVGQCTSESLCKPDDGKTGSLLDTAARVTCEAGFSVIREPIEGIAQFAGLQFDTNYLNWLVGNGFLITTGYGGNNLDLRAKARLRGYFPDRDIYVVPMLRSWAAGSGVHCHTNDQPVSPVKMPMLQ